MLFALTCNDKPDSMALRMETRPAHVDYLKSKLDVIKFAGPLLADDGETVLGSLLIIDVEDKAAAKAFAAADPYAQAGLFGSVHVHGWKQVIPGLEA